MKIGKRKQWMYNYLKKPLEDQTLNRFVGYILDVRSVLSGGISRYQNRIFYYQRVKHT